MASPNLTNRPSEAAKYSDIERRLLSLEQSILSIPSRQPTTRMVSHRNMFTQAAHGFVVGQPIRWNGSTFVAALATTIANATFDGIVESVPDANTFVLVYDGLMTSTLSGGPVYYVQDTAVAVGTTPGTVTMPAVLRTSGGVLVLGPDPKTPVAPVGWGTGNSTSRTTSGTLSWTVPTGITRAMFFLKGGGAGGGNLVSSATLTISTSGGQTFDAISTAGGPGGGEGGGLILDIAVVPTESISITVGAGGAAGTNGNDTTFTLATGWTFTAEKGLAPTVDYTSSVYRPGVGGEGVVATGSGRLLYSYVKLSGSGGSIGQVIFDAFGSTPATLRIRQASGRGGGRVFSIGAGGDGQSAFGGGAASAGSAGAAYIFW